MKASIYTIRLLSFMLLGYIGAEKVLAQEEKKDTRDSIPQYESGMDSVVIPTNSGKLVISFYPSTDSTGKKKSHKPSKPKPRDFWSGIDFGFNGYANSSMQATMPAGYERFEIDQGKSLYFGFNLYELGVPIYKNHVVFVTGLGIDYNNYRFKAKHSPFETPDTAGNYTEHDYIQNRLKTFYATLPLMLGVDFSKPGHKALHLAVGVVTGVRFASYTKEKYSEGGTVIKKNTREDFNLNPFRVNAQARLGYGNFTLFANYALTPMYKDNTGSPDLYPFSFGVSFGG